MLKVSCSPQKAFENHYCLLVETAAAEAGCNNRIVMGPNGSQVVANRVEPPLVLRKSTNTPPSEHVRSGKVVHNTAGLRMVNDPCPERLTGIGADDSRRTSSALESNRVIILGSSPEVMIKACS